MQSMHVAIRARSLDDALVIDVQIRPACAQGCASGLDALFALQLLC